MKKLKTGLNITYKKNGNIKTIEGVYDTHRTYKPLKETKEVKYHSRFLPLVKTPINEWFQKNC